MDQHEEKKINHQPEQEQEGHISRRGFLKGAGLVVAGGLLAPGCSPGETNNNPSLAAQGPAPTPVPVARQYPEVPFAPLVEPDPNILNFFSLHEARTVEALTARILPGTPDDPGAREAGVVVYIDHLLSQEHGWAQPIYRMPPYAEAYEGDQPPGAEAGPYQVIWVKQEELERYGPQNALTPREIYRVGLAAVDQYANEQFGSNFIDLSEEQQDQVVGDLAGDKASGFSEPSAADFFEQLRTHTIEGMFGDPAYGGNRNMVGWKLIGYPGAQRAYTPEDMMAENLQREPQSLAGLARFHSGEQVNEHVIMPVSGSNNPGRTEE